MFEIQEGEVSSLTPSLLTTLAEVEIFLVSTIQLSFPWLFVCHFIIETWRTRRFHWDQRKLYPLQQRANWIRTSHLLDMCPAYLHLTEFQTVESSLIWRKKLACQLSDSSKITGIFSLRFQRFCQHWMGLTELQSLWTRLRKWKLWAMIWCKIWLHDGADFNLYFLRPLVTPSKERWKDQLVVNVAKSAPSGQKGWN